MSDVAAAPPASNLPEYSVSDISGAIKRTLEGAFGRVRVRGELSDVKRYPSGHVYLSLKDEASKLSGVIWKSAMPRVGLKPENGIEVIATGRISAYGDRSTYQLVIERLEYAGAGALLARIEALRVKLGAEGLFDAARKRPLPVLPSVIGVVTSERGAVIEDIRTTILRRFPRMILLWPTAVQGEGAASRIAQAIAGFSAMASGGAIPRPDVLIVARGGGSLEDLMAFNDEAVIRAVAACTIPLISAVGHETDTTLIDFVSDRRAPTPTAAAEMAVPARADLLADLAQKAARLIGSLNRLTGAQRLRLTQAERKLPDLPSLLGAARQRLDDRAERLALALPNLLAARRAALTRAERNIPDVPALVQARRATVADRGVRLRLALPALLSARRTALGLARAHLDGGLRQAIGDRRALAARTLLRLTEAPLRSALREARARLDGAAARLDGASYDAVLRRGFALVLDADGRAVTQAAEVRPDMALRLRFADGEARVVSEGRRRSAAQGRLPL
jgi:exodeoxyribonuclease VII large subunit